MPQSVHLADYQAGFGLLMRLFTFFTETTGKRDPDFCFYDAEAWRKRGEEFGNDAKFTLIVEGAELSVLRDTPRFLTAFTSLIEKQGLWWDMSNCVTYHFYPIQPEEAKPS
jgi:hypothetical protein